jgi:hypothetical protein
MRFTLFRHRCRQQQLILLLVAAFTAVSVQALAFGTTSYITSNPSAGRLHLSTAAEAAPLSLHPDEFPGVLRVAKHLQADLARVTGHEPKLVLGEPPAGTDVVIIGTCRFVSSRSFM